MDKLAHQIFIIIGPSGVGKKTLTKGVLNDSSLNITSCVSATTRAKRDHEIEGQDYYFLTEDQFNNKIKNNEFVEYAWFAQNMYGTLKNEINQKLKTSNILIEVEIAGALNILKIYSQAHTIFIVPPNIKALKTRLLTRQPDMSENELEARLNKAREELTYQNRFDYAVYNVNVIKASAKIKKIIKKLTQN